MNTENNQVGVECSTEKPYNARGAIFAPEAYARGKMLNHTGWRKILPRDITPSDIDCVFDNNGKILLVEYSSKTSQWGELSKGQRLMYANMVKAGNGNIIACCCRHREPEVGAQIDTVRDVLSFTVMGWKGGLTISEVFSGAKWPKFVQWFYGEGKK